MPQKRKRIFWICPLAILALLIGWVLWANTAPERSEYTVHSSKLPSAFEGFRIAQISDLHNADIPDLIPLLAGSRPDIIVITGDLIDSNRTDIDFALDFARQAMQIAPCYYVTGNHEGRRSDFPRLLSGLKELGVICLRNECIAIEKDGQNILITGADDPIFQDGYLAELQADPAYFHILLSHRPELLEIYADQGFDLVFSGHAHGGQFRLPFLGGLYTPKQGLFPEFDAGLFTRGSTQMLVSRGIGNSAFPIRINNRPEILIAELHT